MSDRFKFRFYYKGIKNGAYSVPPQMFDVAEIRFGSDNNATIVCFSQAKTGGGKFDIPTQRVSHLLSKGILMQSTGLKDKNGKLIYEGDIIEWSGDGYIKDIIPSIAVVEWGEDGWELKPITEGSYLCHDQELGDEERFDLEFYSYDGSEFVWGELEIIGNIYENQGLPV